jgi:hypothetical protein
MAMMQTLMHDHKIKRPIFEAKSLHILQAPGIRSKLTPIPPGIKTRIKIRDRDPAKPQPMKNIAVVAPTTNHQHAAIQPDPPIVQQSSQRLRVKITHQR